MQYSWLIVTILVLLVGSCAAGIAIKRRGMDSLLGLLIQIGTTVAIVGVLLHNIFWEREVNQMASKGWTLFYTFPVFLVCGVISTGLAVSFLIRSRHLCKRTASIPTIPSNEIAEQGSEPDS